MCSTSCLKYVLSFFSFITVVIGLAGIIGGVIEMVKVGDVNWGTFNVTTATPKIMLGTGIVALIVGIIGIVGSVKKNNCCLCIY
mmetsp:Transcript_873/g.141  ORF Transcript_873/g.141 Transcript_873/m.141 type:complete len:84 (-) Transcript_873:829-1080(-)